MKKSIFVFAFALISALVSAQCVPQPLAEPGLSPSDDSLDCFVVGQSTTQVIYFQNFDTISGVTVEWLRIDSLTEVPCGLAYSINDPDFTFNTAENGCIQMCGAVDNSVTPGQYKLGIYVTLKVSILPNPISGEAGALSSQFGGPDFSYYLRVKANAGAACAAIDTTPSANNLAGCTVPSAPAPCTVGISNVSQVNGMTISPNPLQNTAEVSFTLDKSADVNLVIYNSVGQRVYTKSVQGVTGSNNVSIERGNLQKGLYLLGIEQSGKSLVSKQLILE